MKTYTAQQLFDGDYPEGPDGFHIDEFVPADVAEGLLGALKEAYAYPQVGGAYQPWMEKAEKAIAAAEEE